MGAAAEKERKEGKRKRREKGRDVLTPILWNHKRHLLTGEKRISKHAASQYSQSFSPVCLCHCVRLDGGDDDGRQIYRGRSGVAGGGRPRQHQLRRRDFAAAEARTFALSDIVRAEILRPRSGKKSAPRYYSLHDSLPQTLHLPAWRIRRRDPPAVLHLGPPLLQGGRRRVQVVRAGGLQGHEGRHGYRPSKTNSNFNIKIFLLILLLKQEDYLAVC